MSSKLDLAVVAAILLGGLVVIETSHRTDLVAPAVAAVESVAATCASADQSAVAFRPMSFDGNPETGMRLRQLAAEAMPADCPR